MSKSNMSIKKHPALLLNQKSVFKNSLKKGTNSHSTFGANGECIKQSLWESIIAMAWYIFTIELLHDSFQFHKSGIKP